MEKFITLGKEFGLEGKELLTFVKEQQEEEKRRVDDEREERQRERQSKKLEAEEQERIRVRELEEKEKERQSIEREKEAERRHELAMKQLELQNANNGSQAGNTGTTSGAKLPKLPTFVDGKDDLDSYLQRFERFAKNNNWDASTWSTSLSALLTGRALDVYSRLSETAAVDYKLLKEALLKWYELTENGFRVRFRGGKPEDGESPEQFITRLNRYLTRWVELSETEKSYEGIRDLFIREQFIVSCPGDLSIYLRERDLKSLDDLAKAAEQFLVAHEKKLSGKQLSKEKSAIEGNKENKEAKRIQCFNCKGYGHKAVECRKPGRQDPKAEKKCFICDRAGHYAKDCKALDGKRSQIKAGTAQQVPPVAGGGVESGIESCIEDNKLLLANGTKLPIVKSGGSLMGKNEGEKMPVVKGKIGRDVVDTLRDTGCSGVVVRKKFVREDQYTGRYCYILLIDNTVREVPIVKIYVDTPYLKGEVEAQCLPDALYDLIIGNVDGARAPGDPDPKWHEACAVTTRSKAKQSNKVKPLGTPEAPKGLAVSKGDLCRMQQNDSTLDKYRSMTDTTVKGDQEISFEVSDGVLYRLYKNNRSGKTLRQVMVPQPLRERVMDVAHSSIMGGHMGVQKTTDKVTSNFYWPGIHGDVTRFCRSCDICQKTIEKGKVPKVPLEMMPLIDTPFKRVAVDLIGPIYPPSEQGHRYILTLVDYATRYPDAVPLKSITTEAVAEALVDMYSRLGVPEEVLSDLGTQFTSECMKEVSRLLSIKQLSTTPYHPICNGLVEKFNGSLKNMLKKLCSEQPKQWSRYINALLFAYREAPQGSTGFAPFELLYGRTVRGPMMILKQLWTEEVKDPDVKTSYEYVFDLRERLEETLKLAREELKKSQVRYQRYYNRKAKARKLEVGSKVLILLPTDKNKLLLQWKGPFVVERVVGVSDYGVKIGDKVKTFHANMLKEYVERETGPDLERKEAEVVVLNESEPGDVVQKDGDHERSDAVLEEGDQGVGASSVSHVTGAAIIEQSESSSEDAVDDDNLLELGRTQPEETANDITLGPQLDDQQKGQLQELVKRYEHIFTDMPGNANLIEHEIKLTSDEPIRSKPYTIPYNVRESLKKDVKEMIRMGVARESKSPYASPVVIVRKKDGTNRVCVDYRKLNRVTEFDPTPMPTAEEIFQKISGAKYLTKLDLSKGYWQIPVAAKDIPKTAFVSPDGSYEFVKMPFGMMNSGATLVRGIRKLLEDLDEVESYVDDIIIFMMSWEKHLVALEEVFRRLASAGFTIRPTKCVLGADCIEVVGHQISGGVKGLQDDNVKKVRDARRPKTKKEVKAFLGLTSYYREFIPNYLAKAVPLSDLVRKGKPNQVVWSDAQEKAYNTLKAELTSSPILLLPNKEKPFTLRTDASDLGLGAVLLQENEGKLSPVSYASRKLTDREKRYSTIERECLAIVWAIRKFLIFLYGVEFTLQTDHQPLVYLKTAKFLNDRVMRWAMFQQNYNIKIESIKGRDNVGADYLSHVC